MLGELSWSPALCLKKQIVKYILFSGKRKERFGARAGTVMYTEVCFSQSQGVPPPKRSFSAAGTDNALLKVLKVQKHEKNFAQSFVAVSLQMF